MSISHRFSLPTTACLLLAFSTANLAFAQGTNGNSADRAWANLNALVAPSKPTQAGSGRKTADQIQSEAQQRAAQAKQTAQAAKNFYTTYPNDPRAAQAKKLESTSLLRGTLSSDADHGQAALQVAAAYRADKTNLAKDRFDVAELMERRQYEFQHNGRTLTSDTAEHEKTAERLRTEFGDTLEVYGFYLAVVNTADSETANRVARKILQQPAPASAKTEAQATADRYAMLGKKVSAVFTTYAGEPIDLSAQGRPTIVFVWSGDESANHLKTLTKHKAIVPPNAQWVYVATNTSFGTVLSSRNQAPFPGKFCYEPPFSDGPSTLLFKNRHVPFVYVIDHKGSLASYGRPDELPALLKAAGL